MSEPAPRIETGLQAVDPRHALDEARLEEWLRATLDEFDGRLAVRQFKGGQSNPTYLLSDGTREWVLRRKPPGRLLSSAHATDREFRILSALGRTDFPVPRVRGYCDDPEVIGTEFYVMDRVEGRILVDATLPDFTRDEREALYGSLVDTLAALHRIDFEAIGLGDYGKRGSYFARQIHVWGKQYREADREAVPRCAAMERMMEWLPENLPADDATTIVHGDYGINNLMIHPSEPRLAAVLDWELSTLGHPLADVAYPLSARLMPTGVFAKLSAADLPALGIPTRDEWVARWSEATGRTVEDDDLEFALAFQLFRSAGIMFGIAARAKSGTAASAQAEALGAIGVPLAERALEIARPLGA